MQPRILFMDDDKVRHELFIYKYGDRFNLSCVYSTDEAVLTITEEPAFDQWFLDHDLGVGVADGTDFVKIVANDIPAEKLPSEVICHSMNPVARRNMGMKLRDAGVPLVHLCEFKYLI